MWIRTSDACVAFSCRTIIFVFLDRKWHVRSDTDDVVNIHNRIGGCILLERATTEVTIPPCHAFVQP
jgi:hypothetical protein